jgi:hypothetical protein
VDAHAGVFESDAELMHAADPFALSLSKGSLPRGYYAIQVFDKALLSNVEGLSPNGTGDCMNGLVAQGERTLNHTGSVS